MSYYFSKTHVSRKPNGATARYQQKVPRRDSIRVPCVACGHAIDDPRFMVSGFLNVLHHECPDSFEKGRKAQEKAQERKTE